ncbi:MAG: PBP1A family penicillin-binding protein [Firmicutes bacterium]|nr:PBP1A family penicillin-binding protein [Bacillota bacterium]
MRAILGFFLKRKIVVTVIVLMILAAGSAVAFIYESVRNLPDIGDVKSVIKNEATYIYAKDGTLITKLYVDNRTIVPLNKISPTLQKAVISIEDQRFYEHSGVDYIRIIGALLRDIKSGEATQGGSTITQQYVKNAYFSPEKTIQRKIREAFLATKLERNYTKEQILEKYLNTIYFGNQAYGIEAASQTYFGIPASQLNLEQSALLAALIRAPESYNPYKNPDVALKRRNLVIDNMLSLGYIKQAEADRAKASPIGVVPRKRNYTGIAPYFADWVRRDLIDKKIIEDEKDIASRGLKIYTTLDPKIQEYAELAWKKYLPRPDDPEAALVAIDPKTGAVKAMVGGRDYNKDNYNIAGQGNGRQPGSSFKPFTLTAALLSGISPDDGFDASSPQEIDIGGGKPWIVHNYSGESGSGFVSLRRATAASINVVYAQLAMRVGMDKVVETARALGLKKCDLSDKNPAITLGGLKYGVQPLEMASAYATFANNGVYNEPFGVEKIEYSNGQLVYEHKPAPKQVIDKEVACVVNDILQGVITGGTGTRARIGRPAAGKTGTTSGYIDAWFCGYTPDLAAAVWVGYRTGNGKDAKPMTNVHGIRVAGGTFPAQIWASFMKRALDGVKPSYFEKAPRQALTWVEVCDETNLAPTEWCPKVSKHMYIRKYFKPKELKRCKKHQAIPVPSLAGLSQDAAIKQLTDLKLGFSIVSKPGAAGTVVDQNPAAGTGVKEGTVIEVGIGDGTIANPTPEPPPAQEEQKQITVPDVIKKSSQKATEELLNAGFTVSKKYYDYGKSVDYDCVGSQNPPGGTLAAKGSEVVIWLNTHK